MCADLRFAPADRCIERIGPVAKLRLFAFDCSNSHVHRGDLNPQFAQFALPRKDATFAAWWSDDDRAIGFEKFPRSGDNAVSRMVE